MDREGFLGELPCAEVLPAHLPPPSGEGGGNEPNLESLAHGPRGFVEACKLVPDSQWRSWLNAAMGEREAVDGTKSLGAFVTEIELFIFGYLLRAAGNFISRWEGEGCVEWGMMRQ